MFVAGSGPTDRNWCSPLLPGTNGSGKLLAEELAPEGFLTLRYDKMASGLHVRENLPKFSGKASMQTHLEELAGRCRALLAEKNLDNLFRPNQQRRRDSRRKLSAAGKEKPLQRVSTDRRSGEIDWRRSRSQIAAQTQALPDPEKFMKLYDAAIAEFLAGKPITMDPAFPRL